MLRSGTQWNEKNVTRSPPPPPGSNPPPLLPFHLKKNFGAVMYRVFLSIMFRGESAVRIEWYVPMNVVCHEMMLSYCGNRLCHTFVALGLLCTCSALPC